jgi:hypothetical protein
MGLGARSSLLAPLLATASIAGPVLATVAAPAGARPGHSPWRCRAGHPQRLIANVRAEVFEIPFGSPPRYEGCAYGSKHRYALGPVPEGSSSGVSGSSDYTLAGTTLAYTEFGCAALLAPGVECEESLTVLNLGSGRRLHHVSTGKCEESILELVLKHDGAVAWITGFGCRARTKSLEVHALDAAGERLLASGTDVAPGSLALAGSRLYWTQADKPFSAPLK